MQQTKAVMSICSFELSCVDVCLTVDNCV